jgi:hypothetical protein
MIRPEEKAAKIKIFKKEEAFYQYMDRFLTQNGYVLLVTSPLKRQEPSSSLVLTGTAGRKN